MRVRKSGVLLSLCRTNIPSLVTVRSTSTDPLLLAIARSALCDFVTLYPYMYISMRSYVIQIVRTCSLPPSSSLFCEKKRRAIISVCYRVCISNNAPTLPDTTGAPYSYPSSAYIHPVFYLSCSFIKS